MEEYKVGKILSSILTLYGVFMNHIPLTMVGIFVFYLFVLDEKEVSQ